MTDHSAENGHIRLKTFVASDYSQLRRMENDRASTSQLSDAYTLGMNKSVASNNILQRSQGTMNRLPPEIVHITQGYVSLQTLISRLVQKTHADLVKTIKDLAQMPLPSASKSNVNGSSQNSTVALVDDISVENLAKKLRILKFTTDAHEAWTKALVITGWSRKAEDVSKVIDLKVHLDQKQQDYVSAIEQMAHDKRGYIHARLPNPDIKTALEVMGTGRVSWMPELGYIPPPQLTPREMLEVLERLNTILSIRLNLDEYALLPYHFRNFFIKSGRVTFVVAGEFELDLTIAEEAPEAQFWFLDLRFMFSPCLNVMSENVHNYLENKLNSILLKDGLNGCYEVLHDLVLTYKISEFRRQAFMLAKYRWVHSVKVEALNRSICIQYWIDRFHRVSKESKPPKNWLILGVHSGMPKNGRPCMKVTRRLGIRWFRENKEQKDFDVPIDDVHISAEVLLTTVVSRHVAHILSSIYESLRAKPLYCNKHLSLSLIISKSDPAKSELKVQLTTIHYLLVRIEPISGLFIFNPPTRRVLDYQRRLNSMIIDPSGRTHEHIELLRYSLIYDSILAHGWTTGWKNIRNPGVNNLEMKRVFKDAAQVHWFRRAGWAPGWYLTISMNMGGECWSLVHTAMTSDPTNPNGVMVIPTQIKMPISAVSPDTNFVFMTTVYIFSAALLSYYENLKFLWSRRSLYMLIPGIKSGPLHLPFIYIRLSDLLTSRNTDPKTGIPWAKDYVRLRFQSIKNFSQLPDSENQRTTISQASNSVSQTLFAKAEKEDQITMVAEIRILKPIPRPLSFVRKEFDPNIVFHPATGSFAFRLCSSIGGSVISTLTEYLTSVERLVGFVKILEKHEAALKCTKICLGKIEFSYGKTPFDPEKNDTKSDTLVYKATIEFSSEENNGTLKFEKGNPHLRIADHLTNILNASLGLYGVAQVIPLTVQLLNGIEAIEETWAKSPMSEYGMVIVNTRAIDWYIIRYTLTQPNLPNTFPCLRKFFFEVRMRLRKGEAWWHVQRHESCSLEESEKGRQDDLDKALQPLWEMSGKDWLGMRVSAVAKCNGIVELLDNLDKVIREFAMGGNFWTNGSLIKAPTAHMASTKNESKLKQVRLPQNSRHVSMSSMNQELHTGVQMRGNNVLKWDREVVEID